MSGDGDGTDTYCDSIIGYSMQFPHHDLAQRTRMIITRTRRERIGWAAGIIEGEGTFSVYSGGKKTPRITVSNAITS